MDQLAASVVLLLVVLVICQLALVAGFVVKLTRFRRVLLPDDSCPPSVVILCVRGADPFLDRCLEAVLAQDYPRFRLHVVVDDPEDPAVAIVERVLAKTPDSRATVQPLARPLATCSLKCSSLVQAVAACDDSIEFIAQLDADTIPHRTWLRELATALSGDAVGAASGNRWYMPEEPSCGALVRYAWNAAAVVQMYWYHIAWGGTLAIKMRVIRELDLVRNWSRAFCEDTMLYGLLRQRGWNVAFVPALMMINRETCDLHSFCGWVQRQLLTARLYHPRWSAVAAHGMLTTLGQLAALILAPVAWTTGHHQAAWMLFIALIAYHVSMFALLLPMEAAVRRIAKSRSERTDWIQGTIAIQLALAVPLTQVVYPWVLSQAMRLRHVEWRGVSYEIGGPWDVKLVEYRPFPRVPTSPAASSASL